MKPVELKTVSDYKSLFNALRDLAGVSEEAFNQYLAGKYPHPGNYFLKDGSYSKTVRYNCEAGIYFTPNLYVDLVALSNWKKNLNATHTAAWCEMNDYRIPALEELQLLQPQIGTVNTALCDVNMRSHMLTADFINECWYQENLEEYKDSPETKRLLVIRKKDNLAEVIPFLAKLSPMFQPE